MSNTKRNAGATDYPLPKIWLRLPYLGKKGEFPVKTCIKKIRRSLKIPVNFIVIYNTKKVSYFISNKDRIPDLSRSNLVYQITCPGSNHRYIGKTKLYLEKRLSEHSTDLDSVVANHFLNCQHVEYLANLNILYDNLNNRSPCKNSSVIKNLITDNFKILSSSNSLTNNQLLTLEALYIKFNRSELNSGLKASKELTLFP